MNKIKEINILASLLSGGGGEQSVIKIVDSLVSLGWKVNLIPWGEVYESFKSHPCLQSFSFENGIEKQMKKGLPLFFYGNDQVYIFNSHKKAKEVVDNSSVIILGINFVVGGLSRSKWLGETNKVVGAIFLNDEKKRSWEKIYKGYYTKDIFLQVLPPCVSIENFINIPLLDHNEKDKFIILRHSRPDGFKFVLKDNQGIGENVYPWQKYLDQDLDVVFYKKIIDEIPDLHFKFMAAPEEIIKEFNSSPNFTFYRWNEMPVEKFLSSGHLYLYRVSKSCRDQGPRVICEAMAAGLPCISEPRDGPRDRISHGENGFYAIENCDYISKIKILKEKESLRKEMSLRAREYAKNNFRPEAWGYKINEWLSDRI